MMTHMQRVQDSPCLPPIEDLLLHRESMLLLDAVLECSDDRVIAQFTPHYDGWYANQEGNMPAWIGIELMAQAIAAHVAINKKSLGKPLKMGALLGTRHYQSEHPHFRSGHALRICATKLLRDPNGLAAYDCTIECMVKTDNMPHVIATAVLKVYEPEDFSQFIQGQGSGQERGL